MDIKPTYVTFEQQHNFIEKGCDVETTETKYGYEMLQQWQVVEWLYSNHDIWISIDMVEKDSFFYSINKANWEVKQTIFSDDFETPQQAYSAAFDYILKELI